MTQYHMTKKDIFNARNASMNIKDYIGEPLTITGLAIDEDDGKPIGYIVADGVGVFGVTSGTLIEAITNLIDLLADDESNDEDNAEPTIATIHSNTSKGGKEFYTMTIA